MLNKKVIEISNEEEEARLAESRRVTAEGQYVIILDDIKRIKGEISRGEDAVSGGKKTLEEINLNIVDLKKKTVESESDFRIENKKLSDFKEVSKESILKLQGEIHEKSEEKAKLTETISNTNLQYEKLKLNNLIELKEIENKFDSVKNDITKEETRYSVLLNSTEVLESKIASINTDLEKLGEEKSMLNRAIDSIKNDVVNQKETIKINDESIKDQLKSIEDKKIEVNVWSKKIEKKQEEFSSLETKAFNILKREELLISKEAYVKSKFEKAGIPFDE